MLNQDEIKKLCKMSRLEFKDEEIDKIKNNLTSIFEWIGEIQAVYTHSVLPLVNIIGDISNENSIIKTKTNYEIDKANTIEVNEKLYYSVVKVIE